MERIKYAHEYDPAGRDHTDIAIGVCRMAQELRTLPGGARLDSERRYGDFGSVFFTLLNDVEDKFYEDALMIVNDLRKRHTEDPDYEIYPEYKAMTDTLNRMTVDLTILSLPVA